MLLICPVRGGDNNPELRYALRSWETNLHIGPLELMTVGYCPGWLKPDHHIEGNKYASVPLAVWDNILTASREAGDQTAIYMNDDFFAMRPIEMMVSQRRNMTLAEHIAIFPQNAGLWWPKSLRTTQAFLASRGYDNPWSYELHRPMLANPRDMALALESWDGGLSGSIPQWRTLYGVLNSVLNGIESEPVEDVKLGLIRTTNSAEWVSTSDQSWRTYGKNIAPRFQKQSRWELG